jgi:hypothetical protein
MADTKLNYTLSLKDASFKRTMDGAASQTKRLDNQMNTLGNTVKRIGVGIAAAFSVGAIVNFGKSVIDALKNYEYFSASIKTLMFGDTVAAKALEGQLVKLAATTPFSLTDVQNGSKQLLAYGFSAGVITKNMKMLGDIASGVGAPLSDIVYLYGTLRTQGRAFSKDINQFTMRGINLLPELAKQFGVTQDKVMGLVEAGKVGFPQVEKAFTAMTSAGGQFFGMMDVQTRTVGGQISMLGDNWEQLKVNIGKSQTGIINSTINWANKIIGEISRVIDSRNKLYESIKKEFKPGMAAMIMPDKRFDPEMYKKILSFQENTQKRIGSAGDSQYNLKFLDRKMQHEIDKLTKQKESLSGFPSLAKDAREAMLRIAVLKDAKSIIQGNLKLLADKGKVTAPTDPNNQEAGKIGSSAAEYSGAKAVNVNIRVDTLGKIENFYAENAGDATQVQSDWRKVLLELLNDANQIANR